MESRIGTFDRIRTEATIQLARAEVSVSAKERTSTGRSDQGALRLKRRRPNEHCAMATKLTTQTADLTVSRVQTPSQVPGGTELNAPDLALAGRPRTQSTNLWAFAAPPALLRLPMVMQTTGLARSTIYKLISQSEFPVPIKLSKRAVAWLQTEVEGWIASRVRAH